MLPLLSEMNGAFQLYVYVLMRWFEIVINIKGHFSKVVFIWNRDAVWGPAKWKWAGGLSFWEYDPGIWVRSWASRNL